MIGIVLAIVLLICKADTNTVLLGLIGGSLFGINFNLSWHRTRAQRKDKAMSRMLDGIVAGIEKGANDGRESCSDNPARSDTGDGQ